ncbi:hypothetical protein KCP75_18815 [Salmonella enterica subsp. enterica]|nr:hypothetical protein KCP75_18815 [Salmonella enterica subsp. enterica]
MPHNAAATCCINGAAVLPAAAAPTNTQAITMLAGQPPPCLSGDNTVGIVRTLPAICQSDGR